MRWVIFTVVPCGAIFSFCNRLRLGHGDLDRLIYALGWLIDTLH